MNGSQDSSDDATIETEPATDSPDPGWQQHLTEVISPIVSFIGVSPLHSRASSPQPPAINTTVSGQERPSRPIEPDQDVGTGHASGDGKSVTLVHPVPTSGSRPDLTLREPDSMSQPITIQSTPSDEKTDPLFQWYHEHIGYTPTRMDTPVSNVHATSSDW